MWSSARRACPWKPNAPTTCACSTLTHESRQPTDAARCPACTCCPRAPPPQLSPRYQAVAAAIYLLPTWLIGMRVSLYRLDAQAQTPLQHAAGGDDLMGASGRSAAVFAVGNAVCGLVVSAVTDLAGRRAFIGEVRRRAVTAGEQGQLLAALQGNGGGGDDKCST